MHRWGGACEVLNRFYEMHLLMVWIITGISNVYQHCGQIQDHLILFSLMHFQSDWKQPLTQSVSQSVKPSVGQCVCDLTPCPPVGMSLSSPLCAGTQMAWGGSDQGEGLFVCQTDSRSVPEAHYQAAATATTTTAIQPPDDCMQLTTHIHTTQNTSPSVATSCL